MANYDASIRIDARMNTKSAMVQLERLENEIVKNADEMVSLRSEMDALQNAKTPTIEFQRLQDEIEKVEKDIKEAKGLIDESLMLDIPINKDTEKRLAKLQDSLMRLKSEQQNLINDGKAFTIGPDAEKHAQLSEQMEQLKQKMAADTQRQSELQSQIAEEEQRLADIKANATVSDERLVNLLEREKELLREIADLKKAGVTEGYLEYDNAAKELLDAQTQINGIRSLRENAAQARESYISLGESVRNAFSKIGKGLIDIPIATVKKGAQGLVNVFLKLGSTVKDYAADSFRNLGNVAKSVFSRITQHVNKSDVSLSKFGARVKGIVMSFFILKQIRRMFSFTVNAIKEGFTNLYNDNLKFKSSVDNLKASLLTMKNSLASAFVPIVETAIPYIQRLVEWVTKAANAVGQLMASLMGRKTYTKEIKQSVEASKDAAEATGDETKAIKKQLSPLDKLNVLTSENAKENEKSKEEDTGLGTMFEEIPISDKFKDIAKWLKDMWENSDFYELGKFLGEKLKSALDNIPWDEIKETARKIGKSIATLINGFVEVEGLGYSIGKTLIEAINTVFEFLNAFVHNLHWESVGKFIADTINGFFENIDWELIYDTFVTGAKGLGDAINAFAENLNWDSLANSVSNFVNTFVDTINTFFDTVDWLEIGRKIGKSLSDAISKIDWKDFGKMLSTKIRVAIEFFAGLIESMDMTELAKAASDMVIGFFDSMTETIENIDWWALGEKAKEFLVNIDWAGVAESSFEAIGAAFGGLAAFLGGLIAEGVEAAREFFQEKIEECGGNVVLGILKGIGDALYDIGAWIKEHIFQPFIDGFKNAFGIHSPSTVMEEMGKYIVSGLLNGLKSTWNTVITWVQEKIQWLVNKIQSILNLFSQVNTAVRSMTSGKLGSAMGGALRTGRATTYSMNPSVNAAIAGLETVEFPGYATGQVIPRTMRQHLAVLGDNNQETEIVSPLSTMKQAFMESLAEIGLSGANNSNSGNNVYEFSVDGQVFFRIMEKYAAEYKKQHGGKIAFS